MIACQKCGITEDAGEGLRILPFLADDPGSRWDWLALCQPCFNGEVRERHREHVLHRSAGKPMATPTWDKAQPLMSWRRQILRENNA